MYVCTAPGLRLQNGGFAEVGKEVSEVKDWPRHMVDLHLRNGKLAYKGDPKDRHVTAAAPARPRFTQAERDRLKALPEHVREQAAQRRGMPAEWLHNPLAADERAESGGVQLTEEQRKAAFDQMTPEALSMAAKARGVTPAQLKGGKVAPGADQPPRTETRPEAAPQPKAKQGR